MEVVRKRKLSQKILIVVLVAITLFSVSAPTIVLAADDEEDIGGGLFTPIQSLVVGLGDAVMWLMQLAFTGSDGVTVTVKEGETAPDITWAQEYDWSNVNWDIIDSGKAKVRVPTIDVSPESIFSGKLPAFDINFFTPKEDYINNNNGDWEDTGFETIIKDVNHTTTMYLQGSWKDAPSDLGKYEEWYKNYKLNAIPLGNEKYCAYHIYILAQYNCLDENFKIKDNVATNYYLEENGTETREYTWTEREDGDKGSTYTYKLIHNFSGIERRNYYFSKNKIREKCTCLDKRSVLQ